MGSIHDVAFDMFDVMTLTELPGFRIVPLRGRALQSAASRLYRDVFGYRNADFSISPRLLTGLLDNGGSALGAIDAGGSLLAFCYGFAGVEGGRLHHYSQATAVAGPARGLGVGRALKFAQADVARATGASTMRWSFDPFSLRNAHFNLAVLGARGIRFHRDYYDEPGSDRVIVEWEFDSADRLPPHVVTEAIDAAGRSADDAGALGGLEWMRVDTGASSAPAPALDREAAAGELARRFDAGWILRGCESIAPAGPSAAHHAAYLFERIDR
jgi:predicted GNAT superfamily acetyltransferase